MKNLHLNKCWKMCFNTILKTIIIQEYFVFRFAIFFPRAVSFRKYDILIRVVKSKNKMENINVLD